jgi:hypothetical protein
VGGTFFLIGLTLDILKNLKRIFKGSKWVTKKYNKKKADRMIHKK